ncbi:hypothetical protein X975_26433, partial [Stegodyphus mimosarum]
NGNISANALLQEIILPQEILSQHDVNLNTSFEIIPYVSDAAKKLEVYSSTHNQQTCSKP